MTVYCTMKGIKHVRSLPRKPWVNGAVERFNRTWGAFCKKIYYRDKKWVSKKFTVN